MPIAKTTAYTMDRRQLMKLTGTMGFGAMFVDPEELFASGMCDKVKIDTSESTATQSKGTVHFWIDGCNFGALSNAKSRANIALMITLKQKSTNFVESLVLIDDQKKVLGARYFDSSMKMIRANHGYPPYVRFENIELDPKRIYKVIFSVKDGQTTTLYVATLKGEKTQKNGEDKTVIHTGTSRLDDNITWLPQKMRNDFQTFLLRKTANETPGLFTTPLQFYTKNGLDSHCSRGIIKDIGSDGSFKINVEFMHGDGPNAGPSTDFHYMRYFVIMDPVGRLVGFHKREFGDPKINDSQNKVVNGSYVEINALEMDERTCWDPDKKEQTTQKKTQFYKIEPEQIADIRDCPYIQIYTEDSYDAMARSIIRLR